MKVRSSTVARRRLRLALQDARKKAELTQEQVAVAMDWSVSKVIRIESGTVSISLNDVRALIGLFPHVDDAAREELLALARSARPSRQKAWWDEYVEAIPSPYASLIKLEAEASVMRCFQIYVMPGILQTPEYAAAIVNTDLLSGPLSTDEHRDRMAKIRVRRREALLSGADPVELRFVLDQAVLSRMVGSPEIMRDQLRYLTVLGENRNVSIQVLAQSTAALPVNASFIVLSFPNDADADVVYYENAFDEGILDRPESSQRYRRAFDLLEQASMSGGDSLAFIAKVADELR